MLLNLVAVVAGLAILARGADQFVVGSARLAVMLRISPVVVGAVVVGFGTGMPELLVSTLASAGGSLDLAVGNVIGSNLANLTLVLGVAGLLVAPPTVTGLVRREAPLSVAAVVLFALLVQGGLTRVEGVVLLAGLVAGVVVLLRAASRERLDPPVVEEYAAEVEEVSHAPLAEVAVASRRREAVRAGLGLLATVGGAQLLVIGARRMADDLGLSGGFVGLTLVAVGTSLPELVTAVQAARQGHTGLLAGNVLGSNLFNSTAVAGVAALVGPAALTDAGLTVVGVTGMVLVAGLSWLFLATGRRLTRAESGLLLAIYAATLPLSL